MYVCTYVHFRILDVWCASVIDSSAYKGAFRYSLRVLRVLVYLIIKDIRVAFRQTLLALKIYSTRYVHYRFSALIASARMQPKFWKTLYHEV